ncbi:MAG: GNAT family acetyltransferase [Thermocaproicibacter melissae]|uniref:hypothetical protein n=1 Tax=Thermocaproicibacter melissae TaxID=2966552 RepID=UPI0024B1CF07|nr:hypothetical protein [Thermocaproicibacter melissae]WBY63434.1 hypothetical protein NOG13_05525 [Thermocaproicibacter melissae]
MRKAIDWHAQYFIPELLFFQNGCVFTGSVNNDGEKEFRYKLSPAQEAEEGADSDPPRRVILVEVWYGPFCYEKSTIEDRHSFPMDENGRQEAINWLAAKYEEMIPG